MALLSMLARPSDRYRISNDGLLLGALASTALAIIGVGFSMVSSRLAGGGDGMMYLYTWIYPVVFAVLDAVVLAVTLGIWSKSLSGGVSGIVTRFD